MAKYIQRQILLFPLFPHRIVFNPPNQPLFFQLLISFSAFFPFLLFPFNLFVFLFFFIIFLLVISLSHFFLSHYFSHSLTPSFILFYSPNFAHSFPPASPFGCNFRITSTSSETFALSESRSKNRVKFFGKVLQPSERIHQDCGQWKFVRRRIK